MTQTHTDKKTTSKRARRKMLTIKVFDDDGDNITCTVSFPPHTPRDKAIKELCQSVGMVVGAAEQLGTSLGLSSQQIQDMITGDTYESVPSESVQSV